MRCAIKGLHYTQSCRESCLLIKGLHYTHSCRASCHFLKGLHYTHSCRKSCLLIKGLHYTHSCRESCRLIKGLHYTHSCRESCHLIKGLHYTHSCRESCRLIKGLHSSPFSLNFSMVAIPVYIKHNIFFREGGAGRLDISISPKQTMGKTVNFGYSIYMWASTGGKPVFRVLIHSRRVVISYKRKYVHKVLVNGLFKLAQEKSVAR